MKKILLKVILFFIILFILLIITSFIFLPKDNTAEAGMKVNGLTKMYGEKENTIDMIVLGNSEAFTSIIPMKIWEDCGYTCQICGYPGLVLPDTMKSLYDATRKQKPKIVILEANVIYDEVSITVPLARVVQTILPITEYHNRWKNLNIDDFYKKREYKSTDHMKGFHYKTDIEPADNSNYMIYTEEQQNISLKSQIYLKILNAYCKKIGAKFMILSVPSTKNWNYEKHNGIKRFVDKENIDFLDYNLLTEELDIDWENDSLDGGDHMNFKGSLKLTDYFEEYIKKFNILESHKGDEKYENWEKDLIKYKDKIEI